jgi:regulator of protease activity HflC (stomatin/prohibitin superfamily)
VDLKPEEIKKESFLDKDKIKYIPIIVILVIIIFAMLSPFETIRSGNVGIKVTLGKYDNEELKPGLHFKIPLIQDIKEVDVKVHTINYKGTKDIPDKEGLIEKPAINVLDERGLPVGIELTVQYRLRPNEASEILQEWGDNWEEKLINPAIRDVVRDVIGQYPAEKLPVKRQEIAVKIQEGIKDTINSVSKGKVEVIGVQLRDIKLPPRIAKKIEEVQIAKQEAEKMKYLEEKALKEQEVRKIKAETEKIEKIIKAEAEAQKRIKEAEGRAKANQLISQSITPNVLKWKEMEVQEKLAEAIKQNPNSTIFLNTPQGNMHYWLNKK